MEWQGACGQLAIARLLTHSSADHFLLKLTFTSSTSWRQGNAGKEVKDKSTIARLLMQGCAPVAHMSLVL
jgi:hypothetical protein